jgi:hypothetical protein
LDHSTRPSRLSSAKIIHVCLALSFARPIPRSLATKLVFESSLIAVITKIWLPQTTGLACDRPGTGVFQITFSALSTSQVVGGLVPSATPDAFGPRNEGQFCALVVVEKKSINRERTETLNRCFMPVSVSLVTLSRSGHSRPLIVPCMN